MVDLLDLPAACSGAMYAGVPMMVPSMVTRRSVGCVRSRPAAKNARW
jgi:hypothetical protein